MRLPDNEDAGVFLGSIAFLLQEVELKGDPPGRQNDRIHSRSCFG